MTSKRFQMSRDPNSDEPPEDMAIDCGAFVAEFRSLLEKHNLSLEMMVLLYKGEHLFTLRNVMSDIIHVVGDKPRPEEIN